MKNKEFLKSLSAIADQLRRTIEAEVVGFESTPAAIAERRAKVFDPLSGFEYFVYTYFPHYVHTADKSQLHEFLFTRLPEILREPKGVPEATGAPRGEGKSTLVTQLFTLYCIVTAQKHYCVIVIETVQFQEFLKTELVKRGAAAGVPIPARGIKPVADKLLRIESLQPHMANGLIRLHASQSTLIQQLRHFPMADHDDGPDALHMLWMLAQSGFGAIDYTAVPRHSGSDGVLTFGSGAW